MGIKKYRTKEQINRIRDLLGPPITVEDVASFEDLRNFANMFQNESQSLQSSVNKSESYNLSENSFYLTLKGKILEEVRAWGYSKFNCYLDPRAIIESIRVYYVEDTLHLASHIHVDAPDEGCLEDLPYKSIICPYYINDTLDIDVWTQNKTIFFNQYYFHNGCWANQNLPKHFWKIMAPSEVEFRAHENFDINMYNTYLDHLEYRDLMGYSVHSIIPWRPGAAIISDRTRFHVSNNYIKADIKKRGHILFHTKMKDT